LLSQEAKRGAAASSANARERKHPMIG
jgi:hypothetical protein